MREAPALPQEHLLPRGSGGGDRHGTTRPHNREEMTEPSSSFSRGVGRHLAHHTRENHSFHVDIYNYGIYNLSLKQGFLLLKFCLCAN